MKEPKKFNIAEAISGKPVQTRDGQLVTQLHEFKDVSFKNSLFGVMNSAVHAWKLNGSYILEDRLHNLDLFMAPIKIKYYIYVYKEVTNNFISSYVSTCSKFDPNRESDLLHTSSFEIDE